MAILSNRGFRTALAGSQASNTYSITPLVNPMGGQKSSDAPIDAHSGSFPEPSSY